MANSMSDPSEKPKYANHAVVERSPADYVTLDVAICDVFNAWKLSLFSHELLDREGGLKGEDALAGDALKKYVAARESLHRGEALEKPVLGIGIYDGIEIGIGREVMAAVYNAGHETMPVCIRKSQKDEICALLKI